MISVVVEPGLSIGIPKARLQINWDIIPNDRETPNKTVKKSYSFIPYFNKSIPEWASTLGHGFLTFPVASKIGGTTSKTLLTKRNNSSLGKYFNANSLWAVYLGSVFLKTAWPNPGMTLPSFKDFWT